MKLLPMIAHREQAAGLNADLAFARPRHSHVSGTEAVLDTTTGGEGVYSVERITPIHADAAVRMHSVVPAGGFWFNCQKFGKNPHFQRWKVAD